MDFVKDSSQFLVHNALLKRCLHSKYAPFSIPCPLFCSAVSPFLQHQGESAYAAFRYAGCATITRVEHFPIALKREMCQIFIWFS